MKFIDAKTDPETAVVKATQVLGDGGLVALPTETVYGLAADATNGKAVARIFEAKGRPQFNPLICHVSDLEMAKRFGEFSPKAEKLVKKFWPGPLTIVVPLKAHCGIHPLVSAGLDTLALRCPRGIVGRIAERLDRPIAAPSANSSGTISPTTAQHVVDDLGARIDLIIDDGACTIGLESTIVKPLDSELFLLRPGSITADMLEGYLGQLIKRPQSGAAIEAPGMMTSHYAPNAILRLNARYISDGEALLAFGTEPIENSHRANAVQNLSPNGSLVEAAANLYDCMKQLDKSGAAIIAVQPIPFEGLGEAINDRLSRAAAPKDNSQ